jgi:hypothetical protein
MRLNQSAGHSYEKVYADQTQDRMGRYWTDRHWHNGGPDRGPPGFLEPCLPTNGRAVPPPTRWRPECPCSPGAAMRRPLCGTQCPNHAFNNSRLIGALLGGHDENSIHGLVGNARRPRRPKALAPRRATPQSEVSAKADALAKRPETRHQPPEKEPLAKAGPRRKRRAGEVVVSRR